MFPVQTPRVMSAFVATFLVQQEEYPDLPVQECFWDLGAAGPDRNARGQGEAKTMASSISPFIDWDIIPWASAVDESPSPWSSRASTASKMAALVRGSESFHT
ncbi:hypothetical protein MPDQ_003718 [Monascus purpureus]|uniref:Uncharacterized protein n=1 Tax=Monascus purpureus TaxID=5098 RepID=A0A507QMD1_MONPU|nr:hypothetical protein MPDQ_003718 [Monascus purpureus]BDD54426.1 hypothetical protein MAP00_000045 [Monascus purpureus]